MKHLISLTFSILFLLFLNACGGGSSSTSSVDDNMTVDTTPPVITLLGNNPETVVQGETYNDSGATALDDRDGTVLVTTTGSVDTSTVGTYNIIYTVTDSAGNIAAETRTVNVIAVPIFPDAKVHDPSFETVHFSGSQNCALCHDGITDSTGKDVSIAKAWHSSMMANAATDPLWKAKVATEVNEHPEFKATIEAKCSRCHTPMATVEATFDDPTGATVALSGDGFLNHENFYYDAAMQGVSCTLCHQIENTPELGTLDGFSGNFVIADNNGTDRKSYGPYTNPKTAPMQNNVQFTPEYSPHMNESKLCASCHNLNTPVIDMDGKITDLTFPEQAAYTEWEYSDFNATQSCQDCHMPESDGSVIIATRGNPQARDKFNQHKFLGANTYMLNIIKQNRSKIGPIADDDSFDKTIEGTRDFLMAAADVNITDINVENGQLKFNVLLTNHSGHKFPTGFPSRRVWLHTTVTNESSQTVFDSGAFSDEGMIIGVDDNTTLNGYQPHYDKITNESQVQVYETILSDTDDNQTYILLHALHYIKDNRILPRGMDKTNVPENINPHGNAEGDTNFIGGSDIIEYGVDSLPQGSYTISVALHYQTLSYGFAQDMYKHDELPEVALMKALDSNTTNHYETISTDTASVIVP